MERKQSYLILHLIKTDDSVHIPLLKNSITGLGLNIISSSNESGTHIWWKDEHNEPHYASVKETMSEIDMLINEALKKSKDF